MSRCRGGMLRGHAGGVVLLGLMGPLSLSCSDFPAALAVGLHPACHTSLDHLTFTLLTPHPAGGPSPPSGLLSLKHVLEVFCTDALCLGMLSWGSPPPSFHHSGLCSIPKRPRVTTTANAHPHLPPTPRAITHNSQMPRWPPPRASAHQRYWRACTKAGCLQKKLTGLQQQ